MLMFAKMSVGVRTMVSVPRMPISSASTVKVYGLRSASRTIHMPHPRLAAPLCRQAGPLGWTACPRRRSHELGADRIGDVLGDDRVDGPHGIVVERPSGHRVERIELLRAARAPERDLRARLIEHP